MREFLVLGLVLLVAANTVNSGAIYRQYRELELPAEVAANAEALPAEGYVAELRKDQIPVQVVDVIEPLVVLKPAENLRSVEPAILIAESEPAAEITNEIIPEKLEKLEANIERAAEQLAADKQDLPEPVAEAIAEAIIQQEEQKLRNIEAEAPAQPAILLAEQLPEAAKLEDLPTAELSEKKLLPEAMPAALPEAMPEAMKESLPAIMTEEKKTEESRPMEAERLPEIKTLKEDKPVNDIVPEVQAVPEVILPIAIEAHPELKSLDEKASATVEALPSAIKALAPEQPLTLIEALKKEEILEEIKEELIEKKKEERREEKKDEIKEEKREIIKEAIQEAIKEDIKEKIEAEIQESPKEQDIAPMAKQADSADPGATTARPQQPGFIQQLVQPLGQFFNNLNPANNQNSQAAAENSPAATAATFIQALQNTTSQITNSIQQGFQQQLQTFQSTFSGQPQQQAAASGDAAGSSTARPQGPLQSIVTQFLGNGAQQQQPAAAPQPQPAGPLQGILNLFGGNRAPNAGAAAPAAAAASSSTPAAELANDEPAPSEAAASNESSSESADDSQEVKPDEIVVSDDDSHE